MLNNSAPAHNRDLTDSITILVFLFFFMFQVEFFAQGYIPYKNVTYVTYAYRSLLAGILFFGLLVKMIPARWQRPCITSGLTLYLLATVIYFGAIVSRRHLLASMNDRAEAISTWLAALFKGEYPYANTSMLHNPISPLTATFILALPAELLFHRPELMTIPFLGVTVAGLAWQHRRVSPPIPFSLIALALVLNPVVIWELSWGSDLMWGSLLLLLASFAIDVNSCRVAALLFGLGLCTRVSYFLLGPLWVIFIYRLWGWRRTLSFLLIAAALVLILEVPFALWSPRVFFTFTPFGLGVDKLASSAPVHDNVISDLANWVLPTGVGRSCTVSLFLLLCSTLMGFKARDIVQLNLFTAALLVLSTFFMGRFFDCDYLIWMVIPLVGTLVGCSQGCPVTSPASSRT